MNQFYRFQVGEFNCVALSDGGLNYPLDRLFSNLPLEEVQGYLAERNLPLTHIYSPYTLLLIDNGRHKVLVDTGTGKYGETAKAMFPDVDNSQTRPGTILESMAAAAIRPEEIDTILITHAHPDHIGGNFDAGGQPNFPNARFYIMGEEWDFWFSDEQTAAAQVPPPFIDIARANLEPLRADIVLLNGREEIVTGITAVPTPGHTPGHMAVSVHSAGERLLHISDIVLLPIHLELKDILVRFDTSPEQTLITRRRICDWMAREQWLVFAHHFHPFPSLGTIQKHGQAWQWKAIDTA